MSRAAGIVQAARDGRYAVGAFNAVNLETAQAVVWAAEAEGAPVILQVSQNAARYAGLEEITAVAKTLRGRASVPVILHYDHAETLDDAQRALALGYDSVMLESADPGELERLAATAGVFGAAVEAEYEAVEKGERAAARSQADLARFVAQTGCHWVAVNVGTRHKQTEKTARLDLERLRSLAAQTAAPLVLHGSSGVGLAELQAAVGLGIAKVNVATELSLRFTSEVRRGLQDPRLHDPRKYLGGARSALTEHVRGLIRALRPAAPAPQEARP